MSADIFAGNKNNRNDASNAKDDVSVEETDSQPIKTSITDASNSINNSAINEKNTDSPILEKPYDWYVNTPELKKMPMTQQDATRFHQCFGSNWQAIMVELGFKMNHIELELENDGHKTQRTITNLIIKWIQKNGREATFGKFIECLINYSESGGSIDWPAVEEVVMKKKSSV